MVVAAVCLVVALSALIFRFTHRGPTVTVSLSEATSGTVTRQVLAVGTLEPSRMVEVGAQVSGTISALGADFNSTVKAGQIIARLDPSVYQSVLDAARAQLAQMRADVTQAQTVLEDAQRKLARAEDLAERQLITQAELDAARIAAQQANAEMRERLASVRSAEAAVKRAEVDLNRTIMRSPIDGVVISRNVDVGQTLTATLQSPVLFKIADLRSMHLLTEVNEGDMGGVQPGARVSFQVESIGPQRFSGTVADVRLQPYSDQSGTLTALSSRGTTGTPIGGSSGTSSSGSANPTGTSGTTASSGSTAPGSTSSRSTSSSTPANAGGNAATANAASASGSSPSAPAGPGTVTYTAVVDVVNQDGRLTPGGTALVTITGGSRSGVIRLPNGALSFRPSSAVLERTGQADLTVNASAGVSGAGRQARVRQVWRFVDNRFVPVDVVTGLSDDRWTEMASGAVRPGDQLVTSAAVVR
jgi:RND family efflux transporter MFP subunit